MRDDGLPKILAWRWAPCVAFVLGSLSLVGFVSLAIPDHIGSLPAESTTNSLRFGDQLASTQPLSAPQRDGSGDDTNTASATPSPAERTAARDGDVSMFPKRGFSPPLERPAPPPTPPPPATPIPPPPQLNVPPPVAATEPAVSPSPPGVIPQAVEVPPPPDPPGVAPAGTPAPAAN